MANFLASDYNGWRTRLINILTKFKLKPANVSGWTGTTVSAGTRSTQAQMDNIKKDIINSTVAIPNKYMASITSLDLGNYNTGSPHVLATKTKIEAQLTRMENTCYHNVDHYDNNDDSDDNDDRDYNPDLGSGDCADDSNVAMYYSPNG